MRVFDQKEICRNILSMAGMFCKSVFSVYVFDDFPRAVCSISVVILFIWGNVSLVCVQCRSVPGTHFPDETKLTGQTELCLKRCGTSFHTDDTGTSSGELSSVQICYDKCLQERDDKNVSISEELTSSFKRIKREIPGSEKSSRDACLMYSPGNFTFLEPKITFREPKDNGSFLGNVSWKPLSSM